MDRDIALRMVTALTGISAVVEVINTNATPSVPAPDNRELNLNMIDNTENMRTEAEPESEQEAPAEELEAPAEEPEPITETTTRKKSTSK